MDKVNRAGTRGVAVFFLILCGHKRSRAGARGAATNSSKVFATRIATTMFIFVASFLLRREVRSAREPLFARAAHFYFAPKFVPRVLAAVSLD